MLHNYTLFFIYHTDSTNTYQSAPKRKNNYNYLFVSPICFIPISFAVIAVMTKYLQIIYF